MNGTGRKVILILGALLLLFGSWALFHKPASKEVASPSSDSPAERVGSTLATTVTSESREQPLADIGQDSKAGCYSIAFKHRHSGQSSSEGCSRHLNQIALNPKATSVCVRVDGDAVAFKRDGATVAFGNSAAPDSVVRIRYCIGNAKCGDPCGETASADPFLAAIGAEAPSKPAKKGAGKAIESRWGTGDHDSDPDVSAHLAPELLNDEREAPAALSTKGSLFKDWVAASVEPACGRKLASAQSAHNREE